MISSARTLLVPVLLFSLAGCGLKGPLYLPDANQELVPAPASGTTEAASPAVKEGSRVRTLPPAPQSQKKDRERIQPSTVPPQSAPPPVSTPDPDRPATTPPPPGQ
jgi:predicted small lipoprotein YifL